MVNDFTEFLRSGAKLTGGLIRHAVYRLSSTAPAPRPALGHSRQTLDFFAATGVVGANRPIIELDEHVDDIAKIHAQAWPLVLSVGEDSVGDEFFHTCVKGVSPAYGKLRAQLASSDDSQQFEGVRLCRGTAGLLESELMTLRTRLEQSPGFAGASDCVLGILSAGESDERLSLLRVAASGLAGEEYDSMMDLLMWSAVYAKLVVRDDDELAESDADSESVGRYAVRVVSMMAAKSEPTPYFPGKGAATAAAHASSLLVRIAAMLKTLRPGIEAANADTWNG